MIRFPDCSRNGVRLAERMGLGEYRKLVVCVLVLGCFVFGDLASLTSCSLAATRQEELALDGWATSLEDAIKRSRISGQPVLVKFEAEWCAPCKQLNAEFAKPAFKSATEKVILVRVDVDRNENIASDFGIESIPHVLLLDSNEETISDRVGFSDADSWVTWLSDSLKGTEFEMPEVLVSDEPPTRTEIKELIETLGSRDPALRQITMERLITFPAKTREPLIESLTVKGKLAQKLSVLEILKRWKAPIDGLDPWEVSSFESAKMERLIQWKNTPFEDLQKVLTELTEADLQAAGEDVDALIATRNVRAGLARMTRYGSNLLPVVYERIKVAETDEATARLTALRYWLTASNELRLGWANGLIELASSDLASRRLAAQSLIKRATLADQPLLLELFADSDPLVRELSLKGLQSIGAKETNATLATLLNDPDPNVRAAVLKSFAESESNQMVGAVAKYLETETDADLIVHALRYLKIGSGAEALKPVLRFVDHESWQVRAEVAQSLGEIDADKIDDVDLLGARGDAVMKLLEDSDGFVVSRAVGSLPSKKNKRLLESMAQIAKRKPDIASAIVESISASANRNSYDSSSVSAAPYLREFLLHDQGKVREAGLKGMVASYAGQLTDEDLAPLLKDDSSSVRLAALEGFYARVDAYRIISENVGSQSQIEVMDAQPSRSSGILSIFGFGNPKPTIQVPKSVDFPKPADAEPADAEPARAESKQAGNVEPQLAEPAEKLDAAVVDPKSMQVDKPKKLKLPKLAEEKWLDKWLTGKIKTELDVSTELVEQLAQSDIEDEKALAMSCLVAIGKHEYLSELIVVAADNHELNKYVDGMLRWLPLDKRTTLFKELIAKDAEGRADALVQAYASVRNPESAKVIWAAMAQSTVSTRVGVDSLMSAYFGDAYSIYYSYGEADVEPDLMELAKNETLQYVETRDEAVQKLVLLMLDKLDPDSGKEIAKKWVNGDVSPDVQDLAFRLLLKPKPMPRNFDHFSGGRPDDDRSYAIEYLKTDKNWKFDLAVRFLAIGEDALGGPDEYSGFFSTSRYYYGNSNSEVKVRIPKPPKGLTLEHLAAEGLLLKDETKAYVSYFHSLLDPKANIDDLLNHWKLDKSNESISKLVFEAVASTNNDEKISVVEEIYKLHGANDISFAAELYWTIRVMDGSHALKLRKLIRDEVGMSQLKRY